MDYKFDFGNRVLNLPCSVLSILERVDTAKLRTLIALAAVNGAADCGSLAGMSGLTEDEVKDSIGFWCGAGVIEPIRDGTATAKPTVNVHVSANGNKVSVIQSGEMPHYTGKEVEALFAEKGEMKLLIDECQRTLGKMLSIGEINKMIALVDYYRLPCEFVLLLVGRCREIGKGTVPYIVRTGISLYNRGIVTVNGLEEMIRAEDATRSTEYTVRRLFGIGDRAMTERERKFISNWTAWQIPEDMLELVYDITVDNTTKPSMPYMNKVLSTWREAGYKTADDVRSAIEKYREKKDAQRSVSSFDKDEFFEAALRHSMEIHKKT